MNATRPSRKSPPSRRRTIRPWLLATTVAAALVGGLILIAGSPEPGVAAPSGDLVHGTFSGDRAETERFLSYDRAITLTPFQETIRQEALTALPAPCCAQFSAATCCCECNMAKATWGLAKHLIAVEGLASEAVRQRVADWHRAINPDGFAGNACFTGGCERAFAHDGCGGMTEGDLVF